VNDLLIGLLAALVTTNVPVNASNVVKSATGISLPVTDPNDPVEREYRKLLDDDDTAEGEVDHWIRENQAFKDKGAGLPRETLNGRIQARFAPVAQEYKEFLQRHPEHVRALLAYGSFLNDTGDEEAGVEQWEKARQLDPQNPATWNNLANYYGHRGPIKKAFEYYATAIRLNPNASVYYQNFATSVFLFRKDAMEFYDIDEQRVFDRALDLYQHALKLDPQNFALATDVAQTYYGIKPSRTKEALEAWNYALKVASEPVEREGIYLHLARVELNSGMLTEAHRHLDRVTNSLYADTKNRLIRNLTKKESGGAETNAPPVEALKKP